MRTTVAHAKRLTRDEEYAIDHAPGWPLIRLDGCPHIQQSVRQECGCLECIHAACLHPSA